MTAAGNAAEGIPRGNIRGGRDPLAGGTRTEMQHHTAHVTWPRRLATPVTARSGMDKGCGVTIFREGFASAAEEWIRLKSQDMNIIEFHLKTAIFFN